MSELPPTPPTTQDFPDHWGFYLLQAINRLDDKIDQVSREQQRATDSLRQEIGGVRQELGGVRQELGQAIGEVRQELGQELGGFRQELGQELGGFRQELGQELGGFRQELGQAIGEVRQEIHDLDAKFDHKLSALQYWYWGTLVVLILGVITLLLTHP